ncbi:MAG: glycosyltransferase [Anaerolineales bacterium]|nr:glycosyltransferase [Anaerolineales bacterium]
MKIAHICQSYPPMVSGQSFMVERLARGAHGLGHEVMVISASDQKEPYTTVTHGIHLVRLTSWRNPLRVGQRLTVWGAGEMKTALQDFQADIVHLHDPTNAGLAGIAAARALRIPVLLTAHAMPWLINAYLPDMPAVARTVESISWAYARGVIRRCDLVVAPSLRAAREIHEETKVDVRVVSNGADLSRFTDEPLPSEEELALRQKFGIPADVPIILHAGRLDSDKNVPAVVRAAARAMRKNNAHLLLAGDGVEREDLIELCKELGIAERSHFPGFVDSKTDLPKVFRMATLFVTASEMEVQSLVLLEAIASGLPVVAVDATSVSEMVEHGKSGYLVRSGDERGMGAAIAKLLNNPDASSFGRRAREIAEQHTLERTFKGYDELYREVLAKRAAARERRAGLLNL